MAAGITPSSLVAHQPMCCCGSREDLNLSTLRGSTVHGARALRLLGLFHRPAHLFCRVVHAFPGCTRYDYCTYYTVPLLQYKPCPFHGFLAGMVVTYTRSNGDSVPTTVISSSECGQYVSIEDCAKGHSLSHATACAHRIAPIQKPGGINNNHPQGIKN